MHVATFFHPSGNILIGSIPAVSGWAQVLVRIEYVEGPMHERFRMPFNGEHLRALWDGQLSTTHYSLRLKYNARSRTRKRSGIEMVILHQYDGRSPKLRPTATHPSTLFLADVGGGGEMGR